MMLHNLRYCNQRQHTYFMLCVEYQLCQRKTETWSESVGRYSEHTFIFPNVSCSQVFEASWTVPVKYVERQSQHQIKRITRSTTHNVVALMMHQQRGQQHNRVVKMNLCSEKNRCNFVVLANVEDPLKGSRLQYVCDSGA